MGSFQSVTVVPHASQKSNQHDPPPQQQRAGQRPHPLRPVEPHLQSSQFSQPSSHTINKTQQRPGYTGPLVWHFIGSSKGAMMQDPESRYRDLGEFCRSAPDSETKVLNPVICRHLMELVLSGISLLPTMMEFLELFSDHYFIYQGETYLWRGTSLRQALDQSVEHHLIGEAIEWGSKQTTIKHHVPFTLIRGNVISSETREDITIIRCGEFRPHPVLAWAQGGTRKVCVEGTGPCILSKPEHPDDAEDTVPLHKISVVTGLVPFIEMFSVHQITEFIPASRPIDDQLKKLLHQQIVVVSTLDKPQNYWPKRFSEFFDRDKEVMMIDMDKVRGSMSDYQLAVGERVREHQVILFKSLSRSRDQRDIFELLGEHRRMWMMTDNVKAELEWLPQEAVYFKPTEQESLEGDGEMKKGTDDDDYEVVDTPDAKLPDTEL